jgi:hypothetical protein
LRYTNPAKWIGFAALAACGALGFLLARLPFAPPPAAPAAPPARAAAPVTTREPAPHAITGIAAAPGPAQVGSASVSPPTVEGEDSATARESALMFAAEPGLIDVLEDSASADPAVRAEAERFLEDMDIERLRENVTRLPR